MIAINTCILVTSDKVMIRSKGLKIPEKQFRAPTCYDIIKWWLYQCRLGCHGAVLLDQRLMGFDGTCLQLLNPAADARRSADLEPLGGVIW